MLATVLVALGLGFSAVARAWLGGNWSAEVTLKQGHELVRDGPYALVRHPIYTGVLLALTGTAVAVGNWRAIIGLVLHCRGLCAQADDRGKIHVRTVWRNLCALSRRSACAHSIRVLRR